MAVSQDVSSQLPAMMLTGSNPLELHAPNTLSLLQMPGSWCFITAIEKELRQAIGKAHYCCFTERMDVLSNCPLNIDVSAFGGCRECRLLTGQSPEEDICMEPLPLGLREHGGSKGT